ncbi:MAG: hypothetical protein M3447_13350 [Acidobacteriota bacterium]|nr:hypothetical protein [Acidobacteriota bacterium]
MDEKRRQAEKSDDTKYLITEELEFFARSLMGAESKQTTDHAEIRNWVEERGGKPARVKDTDKGDGGGLLRIDYPGFSGEDSLEEITWEEFFEAFEENNLAFLYQDKTKDGKESRFSKLIDRDSTKEKSQAARS